MFKQLHRKLTLTNALILICFLLVFSYSIVSIFSYALGQSSKVTLRDKANQIIRRSQELGTFDFIIIEDYMEEDSSNKNVLRNSLDVHYIVWDNNGRLSSLNYVDQDLIKELFEQSREVYENQSTEFEKMKVSNVNYRIYTQYYTLPNGIGGVIQVYQSSEIDHFILNQLFFIIVTIGLCSVIVLIIISSFLAKRSLEPVKQSYERQKEFVADASHELRTPLTIIKSNLEVLSLKEEETIAENKKWFDNIYTETDVMAKLVQNLLTLAQMDNKQISANMQIVVLSLIVENVCKKMSVLAREKDILLQSIIADDVLVKGDQNGLEQLFVILIDNAIKYTPKGGQVKVSLMTTSDKAYISVKDTGIGIEEEDKNKIFERFYRVDKVRSREQGGVGLGLSIAKWIIDEHKATLEIKSKLNEGSEFIIGFTSKNK